LWRKRFRVIFHRIEEMGTVALQNLVCPLESP
jgi:hypothetical protein